ncbi:MAG TPA: ABC transporter ATP-binding protein [Gemmatimonadaceae bacterium]|nr:ABC transporter ATP-binding protein [Gemmatimonadaceae bacterium]
MITFDSIRKSYGVRNVLRDVSLGVRPGTVTGLVGPNASGKTTLIKIALGLTRADTGEVHVGHVLADPGGAYRERIGYMPQIAHFPENLRVHDLFDLIGELRPSTDRDEELLRAFQLHAEFDRKLVTLSGGTRQKVNAAIAFLARPDLLILDEPTAGLDPVASGILKQKIRTVRDEGRTVLITSHIMSELEELADDIAFLCDGALQFTGSVDALLSDTHEVRLEDAIASLMRKRRPIPSAGDSGDESADRPKLRLIAGTAGKRS